METQQGYKTKNRTGNETGDDVAKTYNFGYNYVETRPHILDAIDVGGGLTRNYANDASGNNTGYQLDYGGYMINVTIDWDEEDRIKQYTFVTPGGISNEYYWYDNEVQRMIKRRVASGSGNSISNETLYPSQYYSVYIDDTSDEIIMRTKNVYVGNQRVVSVLNPDEQTRYEYYYHTDHLGSTTYLTDRDGKLKEHIEYTPWGEGWIEQPINRYDLPQYLFTGKELDATGLYYYGARYYDPRISMWLSADPIIGKYIDEGIKWMREMDGDEMAISRQAAGVFDGKNMALYTYCHHNPIILVDPDGEFAQVAIGALVGGSLDIGLQVIGNKLSGEDAFENIDWRSVAISAGVGAAAAATGIGGPGVIKKINELNKLTKALKAETMSPLGLKIYKLQAGKIIKDLPKTALRSATASLLEDVISGNVKKIVEKITENTNKNVKNNEITGKMNNERPKNANNEIPKKEE